MRRHVYIVVLNWNGWRDTVECLESLFRLDYPHFTVVVCDNASADNSLDYIGRWADGGVAAASENRQLADLTTPAVPKPIHRIEYPGPPVGTTRLPPGCSLVLIQTGSNRGFAAGCNVGMRFALAQRDCEFVWLLNNDTVVDRNSLSKMVEHMLANLRLGICGSVLLNYHSPDTVQAYGGRRYTAWCARVKPDPRTVLPGPVEPQSIDYVLGASMLVRREFLDSVGLLEEAYYFYFEELDWAARASDRFTIGYAPLSYVYHKEGASLGTRLQRSARSMSSEWYVARSRILFTRKFYPVYVPVVLMWVGFTAVHRLLTGQIYKAAQIANAAWAGLTYSFLNSGSDVPLTQQEESFLH